MTAARSVLAFECSPVMSPTSVYVPQVSCSPATHTSPGDSLRPAGKSGAGSYQITDFALGPGVHEILCVPFKSEVSNSPNPVGLLQLTPVGLQCQMLWGLVFLVPDPLVPDLLEPEPPSFWSLLYVSSCSSFPVGSSLYHRWLFCA